MNITKTGDDGITVRGERWFNLGTGGGAVVGQMTVVEANEPLPGRSLLHRLDPSTAGVLARWHGRKGHDLAAALLVRGNMTAGLHDPLGIGVERQDDGHQQRIIVDLSGKGRLVPDEICLVPSFGTTSFFIVI